MDALLNYLTPRISLREDEIDLLKNHFILMEVKEKTLLSNAGKPAHDIYFVCSGIVRGYQLIDGKIVVEHLVDKQNFFTSIDSFLNGTPSAEYFETITPCTLLKISRPDLDRLRNYSTKWNAFIETIIMEHLNCKLERVRDFQTLTAKERYIKFLEQTPNLALHVSIENIASFLGMEPQSLSRIRGQLTF